MTQEEVFKTLVAHAKEYGFIFQSSEIYDGLSAVYDYGQMGVEMKNNIGNIHTIIAINICFFKRNCYCLSRTIRYRKNRN